MHIAINFKSQTTHETFKQFIIQWDLLVSPPTANIESNYGFISSCDVGCDTLVLSLVHLLGTHDVQWPVVCYLDERQLSQLES